MLSNKLLFGVVGTLIISFSLSAEAANFKCVGVKCKSAVSSSSKSSVRPVKKAATSSKKSTKTSATQYTQCTSKAWTCYSNFSAKCVKGKLEQTCFISDRNCLNPEVVRPTAPSCSVQSSLSSVSAAQETYASIMKFLGKSEYNLKTMEEAKDAYSSSPSHRALFEDISDVLFDFKGAYFELESYGKIAEKNGKLTAEENKEVLNLKARMNDLIDQYNKILPSR